MLQLSISCVRLRLNSVMQNVVEWYSDTATVPQCKNTQLHVTDLHLRCYLIEIMKYYKLQKIASHRSNSNKYPMWLDQREF